MMQNLTGIRRDILYVIAALDEPYGLEIKEHLEAYYEQEFTHSQLYSNLDELIAEGHVEKGTIDKRTNSYTLTDRGNRTLRCRRDWERAQAPMTTGDSS